MSVFSKTHFAYLDVKTQFKLNNVPASAIFDELQRTYETDIYARLASPKGEWLETALVGRMQINLLRFDVALNLGRDGHLAADAVSTMAAHIFLLMDKENGPLGLGAEKRLSCLLVTNLKIDQAYRGTTVEREAVRTALIGLSTGVTRAFLDLGEEAAGDVKLEWTGKSWKAPFISNRTPSATSVRFIPSLSRRCSIARIPKPRCRSSPTATTPCSRAKCWSFTGT